MKFVIDDTEYEAVAFDRLKPFDLLELKRQTGIGLQTMIRLLQEGDRLAFDDDGEITVLPEGQAGDFKLVTESVPHLTAFLAFFWTSRRLNGERTLTYEQACDFQFTSLNLALDDGDEEPEEDPVPDPPAPAASAPDE